MSRDTISIGETTLEEGDTLWRLRGLNTVAKSFNEQNPDDVIQMTARQLVDKYPEMVGEDVDNVAENLQNKPGYYDDTDLMRYHPMQVTSVRNSSYERTVRIKDMKERRTFSFTDSEIDGDRFEPLEALEKHLGITVLKP